MPKPTRDYARLFKNEIAKVESKIDKLQDERRRLISAYQTVTGDDRTYAANSEGVQRTETFRDGPESKS